MEESKTRRFVDPVGYIRREDAKNPSINRKYKLNRGIKAPITYKRWRKYTESKLNTGREKYIFMFRYKAVVRFLADTNDITPRQLEFLIAAYSFDYFIIDDLLEMTFTPASFKKKEWIQLKKGGFVQIYMTQKNSEGLKNLYRLSYKGNKLVSRFYKMLFDEEDFPKYAD